MYSLNSRYACKINIFVKFIQIIINKVFLLLRKFTNHFNSLSVEANDWLLSKYLQISMSAQFGNILGVTVKLGKPAIVCFHVTLYSPRCWTKTKARTKQPRKPGSLYLRLNSLACEVGQSDAFVLCTSTDVMCHLWG